MSAIKREFFIHFSYWLSFFVIILLIRQHFVFGFWPFWLGGLVGMFLPDIDHLLYLYLKPKELTSQRAVFYFNKLEIKRILTLLYETRSERKNLIFHTIFFQILFVIVTFWFMSSSISLFGKGIVLSFSIHLIVDQMVDISELENFENWTKNIPYGIDLDKAKIYTLVIIIVTIFLGLLA